MTGLTLRSKGALLSVSAAVLCLGVLTIGPVAIGAEAGPRRGPGGPMPLEVLDRDGDGQVTRAEAEAKPAEEFEAHNADGNDGLDLGEFEALMEARRRERLARGFARLDKDDNGTISAAELAAPVDRMFQRQDRNDDGVLTEDEMKRHGPGGPGRRGPRGERRDRN